MILQALVKYYETLAEQGKIAKMGWGEYKISYALDIKEDGSISNVVAFEDEDNRGRKVLLPQKNKTNSANDVQFLWNDSKFLLGCSLKKGKDGKLVKDEEGNFAVDTDEKRFSNTAKFHNQILQNCNSECANAIKNFFKKFDLQDFIRNNVVSRFYKELLSGCYVTLMYKSKFVSEYEDIRYAWDNRDMDKGDTIQQCLVTGKNSCIARKHPKIEGLNGALFVSFNKDAFESYGKSQSYNSSISEYAAFAYTTALNKLLSDRTKGHTAYFGDTTVVYWAEDGQEACRDLMGMLLNMDSDNITDEELHEIMTKLSRGETIDFKQVMINPKNKFYIMGISVNEARIIVRFFYEDIFGNVVKHFREHYECLQIVKQKKLGNISIRMLLEEMGNKYSKDKKVGALFARTLLRTIVVGEKYPISLYQNTILRAKLDQDIVENGKKKNFKITPVKAAIIKACLQKNYNNKEEATVALNEETKNVPYVLGRLFAVLEALQQAANPGLNSTIKDRYFSSACATPNVTFPILLKLAQHHLNKLTAEPSWKVSYEKKIGQLADRIEMNEHPLPAQLDLEDQGKFILGYYHQVQSRYEKKEEKENE